MTIAVRGRFLRISANASRIWTRPETSTALIGSSASTMRGSATIARAMATRCACPPDISTGYRPMNSSGSSPTIPNARRTAPAISSDAARLPASPALCPACLAISPSAIDSPAVQRGSSEVNGFWNTSPDSFLSRSMPSERTPLKATPRYVTVPESACSKPNAMRVSVVFPDPDPPITARHSPSATSISTLNSTWVRREREPKDLSTPRTDSSGSFLSDATSRPSGTITSAGTVFLLFSPMLTLPIRIHTRSAVHIHACTHTRVQCQ